MRHLQDGRIDIDTNGHDADAAVQQAVDPAVQRSMLTAKSLQELMRGGGLEPEDEDQQDADFSNLLANAEPLPAGAAELGPSSLFEAHRASDGSLDIESILQQRARMAAIEDHNQAGPSKSTASMLDLSQASPKPVKRPVIEVLRGDDPASRSSNSGSSQSSSDSDASSSSKNSGSDSDEAAVDRPEEADEDRRQAPPLSMQPAPPTPMDQIAIVDGVFKIIPAQCYPRGEQALDGSDDERMDSASDADGSDDAHSADDDEDDDVQEDDEVDSDDDQLDTDDHGYTAQPTSQHYYDGFGGVGTRDLLYEGPVGDADEPIVLSDSDDDDDRQQEEDNASSDGRDSEEGEDEEAEEAEEGDQDELASSDSEGDEQDDSHQADIAVPTQPNYTLQQQSAVRKEAVDEQQARLAAGKEEGGDAEQGDTAFTERKDALHDHAENAEPTCLANNRLGEHEHRANEPGAVQRATAGLQEIASGAPSTQQPFELEGDGMPDSEVEPEEVDEDLRWSDIEAGQSDDDASAHAGNAAQPAPANAAFRAIQGAQAMPGFVSAAQIFVDIQAAESESKATDSQSSSAVNEDTGRIDPQLLAEFAGAEHVPDPSSSTNATTGTTIGESIPSNSQTEAYIFDAFTRQDASSDAHNLVDERSIEAKESMQAAPEAEPVDQEVPKEHSDPPTDPQPLQPEDTTHLEGSAADENVSQDDREGETEANISSDAENKDKLSPIALNQDEVQEREADQGTGKVIDAIAASEEANEPVAKRETSTSPPRQQEEEAPATHTPSVDAVERFDATVETIKPKLARVESTDVLEADVEDNSEEEAALDQATVELSSVSVLPATAAIASSDSEVNDFESSSIARAPADGPVSAAAEEVDASVLDEGAKSHISVQAQEEEGILSGDLADLDTSIERQDGPEATTAHIVDREDEAQLQSEVEQDAEQVISVASPASSNDDNQDEPQDATPADEGAIQLQEEESSVKKEQEGDDKGQQDTATRSIASITVTQPEVSQPKEDDRDADVAMSVPANARTPTRVPPSPTSSDRRSTSSFTPSTNRQGNRHLHGAAKRSFFAQVTEAASGLASNLTAPLRAIPSLLPINERRAEETLEENEGEEATTTTANDGQGDAEVVNYQQPSRPNKSVEAITSPMTTRSHCICRKLRLSKVEGAPVFIVPGCSINYEQARKEGADDLGPTDERLSDDWITVDPDFIPNDVHHMLSRIIGLQFLNEGICVEPDSTAAELVYPDLDVDLFPSLDGDQKRTDSAFDGKAKEENSEHTAEEKSAEAETEAEADMENKTDAATAEAEVNDDDTQHQGTETPSRATRRSTRHRRTSSAASTSSLHRSPRHPDPKSPNADYLPDEERRRLLKDRHPPAAVAGDVSIASLEEQIKDEEAEAEMVDEETKILAGQETEDADTNASSAPLAFSSPQPKRKRGRTRKSVAVDTSTVQEGSRGDEVDTELVSEPQPKKRRGRKSSASGAVDDFKDVEDAAAVENALDTAPTGNRKGRRGRKSQAEPGEHDGQDQADGSSVRTPPTSKSEDEKLQQGKVEDEDRSVSEAQQDGKTKRGGKGGNKRKQTSVGDSASTAEAAAPAVEKVPKVDQQESVKSPPRRSGRSQGGASAKSPSPSKNGSRKSQKRKVLKLN